MPSVVVNTTELSNTLDHFGTQLLSALISCLVAIALAVISAVVAYVSNNAKLLAESISMRELKSKQIELHKENNEIKRNTPKSSSPSS